MKISYVLSMGKTMGSWELSDQPARRTSFSHGNGTPIHVLQVITPNNRLFCDRPYYTEIMASFDLPVNRTGTNKRNSFFRLCLAYAFLLCMFFMQRNHKDTSKRSCFEQDSNLKLHAKG
jgi:hypothetical protein